MFEHIGKKVKFFSQALFWLGAAAHICRSTFCTCSPKLPITAISSPKTAKSSCLRCAVSRRFFRRPMRREHHPSLHRKPTDPKQH